MDSFTKDFSANADLERDRYQFNIDPKRYG